MAGVTDTPYRILAQEMGCAMAFAEMVSVLGIRFRNEKTLAMLKTVSEERPIAMQLFGAQPEPAATSTWAVLRQRLSKTALVLHFCGTLSVLGGLWMRS